MKTITITKNTLITCFTILFLILTSCEQDFPKGLSVLSTESEEQQITKDFQTNDRVPSHSKGDDQSPISVGSLHLDCIPNSNFVVRSVYDNQTNILSFEYYTNSASNFTLQPASIDWLVSDGQLVANDSGNETATGFIFNTNFNVDFKIVFDDNSTFQDQFCVNIDQFRPSKFNVCSNHQSTDGCNEGKLNKRLLVVIDIVF